MTVTVTATAAVVVVVLPLVVPLVVCGHGLVLALIGCATIERDEAGEGL